MKSLIFTLVVSCFNCGAYALSNSLLDKALLDTAKASAATLLTTCVGVPTLNEEQIAECTAIKVSYMADLALLVKPASLEISHEVDLYAWSVFTPCHYEVAFLIVPDICITKPSLT